MSTSQSNNGSTFWRPIAYALATFSQAMIMLFLFLILQEQATISSRLERVEIAQSKLEGIVSMINANNPAVSANQSKQKNQSRVNDE